MSVTCRSVGDASPKYNIVNINMIAAGVVLIVSVDAIDGWLDFNVQSENYAELVVWTRFMAGRKHERQ
ncbi:unnamed protein product [Heligmosomoides polygyrus]|uniref:Uncharacterized protein n=1 Tax=Heligmosomoides polygyrus TaxID=6339 RepID=A0A3P8DIW8_HELPZ|nr:unnamed protein product [Heligmosomoides polygyrus]